MSGINEMGAQGIMDELEDIHTGALAVRELAQSKGASPKAVAWAADRIMSQLEMLRADCADLFTAAGVEVQS